MYLSWRVMLGKKSYTVVCHENILPPEIWGEKKTSTNQIMITLSKVKWSAPIMTTHNNPNKLNRRQIFLPSG